MVDAALTSNGLKLATDIPDKSIVVAISELKNFFKPLFIKYSSLGILFISINMNCY
jgi:hypothetical protein